MLLLCDCSLCGQLAGTGSTPQDGENVAAVPTHSLADYSASGSDPYVTYGWRWGGMADLGKGAQVSWSFAQSSYGDQPGGAFDTVLNGEQQKVVRAALERWEQVCGIDFVEKSDSASVQLRFGMAAIDGAYSVLGRCNFQYNSTTGSFYNATIRMDTAESWNYAIGSAPPSGQFSYYTVALHEIGHAIGLAHSSDPAAVMYSSYGSSRLDLHADDIAGAVHLYGSSKMAATTGSTGSGSGSGSSFTRAPTEGNDVLHGTSSADRIDALGGNDTVNGYAGNDTITGGSGRDRLYGDDGNDALYGNEDADNLYGGQGRDTLYGGQGDDLIYGNLDADMLFGNLGNDVLFGGQGGDTVHGGMGVDRVYGNLGEDELFGGLDDDDLYGGQGNDRIAGDAGNDRLFGNLGNDTLTGGDGMDIFLFSPDGGADVIVDFQAGFDRIQLAPGMGYAVVRAPDGAAHLDLGNGHGVTLAGMAPEAVDPNWIGYA